MFDILNFLDLRNKCLEFNSEVDNPLISMIRKTGCKNNDFYTHAYISMQIRLGMMILPDINENHSYNQRYKIVENYLTSFSLDFNKETIEKILEIISNINKYEKNNKKDSWSRIHYKEKDYLLKDQNFRCKVCGTAFVINDDSTNMNRPELDHIVPFILGGNNEKNTRIVCKKCNISKGTSISFVNENIVAMNYFINNSYNKNKVIYWIFERDKSKCTNKECLNSSKNSKLFVEKIHKNGRFIYDNLKTVCESCYKDDA